MGYVDLSCQIDKSTNSWVAFADLTPNLSKLCAKDALSDSYGPQGSEKGFIIVATLLLATN